MQIIYGLIILWVFPHLISIALYSLEVVYKLQIKEYRIDRLRIASKNQNFFFLFQPVVTYASLLTLFVIFIFFSFPNNLQISVPFIVWGMIIFLLMRSVRLVISNTFARPKISPRNLLITLFVALIVTLVYVAYFYFLYTNFFSRVDENCNFKSI